jgi:hypothetical protein
MAIVMALNGSRYEWLNDYLQLKQDISYLKWNINKTGIEASRWTNGDLANMHVMGKNSRPAKLSAELDRLHAELKWREQAAKDLKELVDCFDGIEEQILRKKYIEGQTLEDIAEELNYSTSYVRQKHAELHRRLDFIDKFADTTVE